MCQCHLFVREDNNLKNDSFPNHQKNAVSTTTGGLHSFEVKSKFEYVFNDRVNFETVLVLVHIFVPLPVN